MQKMKSQTELEILQNKSSEPIADLLVKIAVARVSGDTLAENEATNELELLLRKNQGIADLLGRKRTILEVTGAKPQQFAEEEVSNAFNYSLDKAFDVSFNEASTSILDYQLFNQFGPKFYNDTIADVNKTYSENAMPRHRAFGVLDAKQEAFDKVNSILRDSIEFGTPKDKAIKKIKQEMIPFAKSQAETIYRTQTAKAYSAGRWRQIENPAVRTLVGAIQFNTVGDRNTRPEHAKINGFIGAKNDPIWEWITPPIYFNCRCSITIIPKDLLKRRGLLDRSGNLVGQTRPPIPSENFGQRPDRTMYN